MQTATKQAIDPKIYVVEFNKYAEATGTKFTEAEIVRWDAEVNGDKLRTALIQRYGKDAIFEIGIRTLFSQYLYNVNQFAIKPDSANPIGLKQGVTGTTFRMGRLLSCLKDSERACLVAVQKGVIKAAIARLRLYELSNEKFLKLVQAFEDYIS